MKHTEKDKNVAAIALSAKKATIPSSKALKMHGRKYILYGDKNEYPDYLKSLRSQAEHNAILSAKIDWIARNGWNLEGLTPQQTEWFAESDMDSLIHKITNDYETYGGFAFYVYRNRGGGVYRLEYEDFAKIRIPADEEDKDNLLIGEDWTKYRTDVEYVPKYNPDEKEAKSLYYYTGPLTEAYPVPSYFGGVTSIQTMIDVDTMQLNLVQNGFFVPTVISFRNGVPELERQEEIGDMVKKAFTSQDNAGELLVLFNEPDTEPVSIDTIETDELDKKFQAVIEQKLQSIFTAHKVTSPALFGVKTPGQLGNRKELVDAWNLFQKNYISPTQQLLEGIFTDILSENWTEMDLQLEEVVPIEAEIPLEHRINNMTLEERRAELDLKDEMTDEDLLRMKIAELPQDAQRRFYESISLDELYKMVGYTPNQEDNDGT